MIKQEYLNIISGAPALQSLLYDLNILPEQVKPGSADENVMKGITIGYHLGAAQKDNPWKDTKKHPHT